MFIEAKDISNPAINPIYSTIQLSLKETYPYFKRKPGSGELSIYVEENTPLGVSFYNISSLVYNPSNLSLFFHVRENNYPFNQSDTFGMSNTDASLRLINKLNAKERDFYRLFVSIKNNSTIEYYGGAPSNANETLLFIDIRVLSKSSNLEFIELNNITNKYMCK